MASNIMYIFLILCTQRPGKENEERECGMWVGGRESTMYLWLLLFLLYDYEFIMKSMAIGDCRNISDKQQRETWHITRWWMQLINWNDKPGWQCWLTNTFPSCRHRMQMSNELEFCAVRRPLLQLFGLIFHFISDIHKRECAKINK